MKLKTENRKKKSLEQKAGSFKRSIDKPPARLTKKKRHKLPISGIK